MLRLVAKILKVLNSEGDPWQISLAAALGMVAGLTPMWSLHNVLIVFLALMIRVNLSTFLGSFLLFSAIAYAIDPLFHSIGLALLTSEGLKGLWTSLYQGTVWRAERFNNTIVMGSLVCSLVAFVPFYFLMQLFVRKYREHILAWVRKTRIMRFFQASKLYAIYERVSGW
jgi:uncharacterized protein (TIGR03546 family)